MVSYDAPSKSPSDYFVSKVQSQSCERLQYNREGGSTPPPAVALALRAPRNRPMLQLLPPCRRSYLRVGMDQGCETSCRVEVTFITIFDPSYGTLRIMFFFKFFGRSGSGSLARVIPLFLAVIGFRAVSIGRYGSLMGWLARLRPTNHLMCGQ